MSEQPLDLWAESRDEVAVLMGQLRPEEALEVLERVVMDCIEGRMLAPVLVGTIRGMVERLPAPASSTTLRVGQVLTR